MKNLLEPEQGPIQGIRVADFSRVLAGPFATMMLADLGAEVIKIESPDGDDTRRWVPPVDVSGTGTYFSSVNRNKRSVVCDLATVQGSDRARRLAVNADVVIENFRPGSMEKFGLGYAELREHNPALVFCSITGFGAGAGAGLPGYDLLVQALGGLMSITGEQQGEPAKAGVAVVDVLTGYAATTGILAAVRHAERTGVGQKVEVDLLSTLLSALVNQASSALATGESPRRMGNAHPSIAPYETFRAADTSLVIAVGNDRQFRECVRVLGLSALGTDPRFADNASRVANSAELREELEGVLKVRSAEEWVQLLSAARVPAGRVNTVLEAFALAETLGLDPVVEIPDTATGETVRLVANPIRLSETPANYSSAPPLLGEHDSAEWMRRPATTSTNETTNEGDSDD